jgi:hypothetical protein
MKHMLVRAYRVIMAGSRTPRGFAPDYRDAQQWQTFATSPAAMNVPGLATAVEMARLGRQEEAAGVAVNHFVSGPRAAFFAEPMTLHASQDPMFVKSVDYANVYRREATNVGLRIYDRIAQPLRGGFPWHDPVGMRRQDLLYAVHPHRFAFLPPFALATATGNGSHSDLVALLEDWMGYARSAPDLPFCSNLVVIERLLAAVWAFAFLAIAKREYEARWRLLAIIGQDIAFLQPRLGHSYPNNHLLLDRFAAWYIALLLPEWLSSDARVEHAEKAWLEELVRQTYDDGGSVEHCAHYHGLATEMAAAYLLLSQANERAISPAIRKRIRRMLDLQSALCGTDGNAAQIGDSSDDSLFPLDGAAGGNAAALREIGRAIFTPERASVGENCAGRTRAWWLLGGRRAPAAAPCTDRTGRFIARNRGGIVVFSENDEASRCTFRLGPMIGTQYLPGHQHADALSVTATHGGVPFLVDAGTCTYRFRRPDAKPEDVNWRAYFAGAQAHNGLVVEDDDPFGRMRGDFRPTDRLPEVSTVGSGAGRDLAFYEARLSAHRPFPDWRRGVIHLRGVGFIVYDSIRDLASQAPAHFAFQWAAHCEIDRASDGHVDVRARGKALRFAWSAGLGSPAIVCGRVHPTNGWMSPAYGERLPAPQLLVPITREAGHTAFVLDLEEASQGLRVECERSDDARIFRLVRDDGTVDIVLLNSGSIAQPITADGCTFEGRIAWIRIRHRERPSVRWVEGRSLSAPRWSVRHAFSETVPDFAN